MPVVDRSSGLGARLADIEERLRTLTTVTNTPSSEVSGGVTYIDALGDISFHSGGTMMIGSGSVSTSTGSEIIDSAGNLVVDDLTVSGDILSAQDYMMQREKFNYTFIDILPSMTTSGSTTLYFPDWASSSLANIDIELRSRSRYPTTNIVGIKVNGKLINKPVSKDNGDIDVNVSVVRRVVPEAPNIVVEVEFYEEPTPRQGASLEASIGGIYFP